MAGFTDPETYAINYLRNYWWSETAMSVLGLTTFQDALAYYRKLRPAFLRELSDTVKNISQDRVKRAFADVANEYGTRYPPIQAFYDALAAEVGSLDFSDVREVAKETAKTVQSVATIGLGTAGVLLVVAGIAALAFYGAPLLSRGKRGTS